MLPPSYYAIKKTFKTIGLGYTAKETSWHATGKYTEPGKMQHPVDGRAWKNFDTQYPDFAAEPRNVRLGLAGDGFNPFDNLSQSYNMWPIILTTYNLPPWLCMKVSSLMLSLLIPGPKSPGKDIDV
ncbi:retrotransposon gag domain, retroviral aspartyl protease [Tanacetum coccineum]